MTSPEVARHVLLVGGSSSVGKTTVARELAKLLACEHVETHRALKSDPALQPLQGSQNVWNHSIDELRDLLIRAAAAASPILESPQSLAMARVKKPKAPHSVKPQRMKTVTDSRCASDLSHIATLAGHVAKRSGSASQLREVHFRTPCNYTSPSS